MAATTVVTSFHGAAGATQTTVDTESSGSGLKFNLDDDDAGTDPIQIPTATGTNYSWTRYLGLRVTVAGATSISNRRVYNNTAQPTGIHIYYLTTPTSTYTQPSHAQADSTSSNNAVPSSYTELTATTSGGSFQWDNASVSTGSTGLNGKYLTIQLGVGSDCPTANAGAYTISSLKMQFDEA